MKKFSIDQANTDARLWNNRPAALRNKSAKADMFSSPDNRVIRDPLNADIRDLDVSSALLRMWYNGLEAKGY